VDFVWEGTFLSITLGVHHQLVVFLVGQLADVIFAPRDCLTTRPRRRRRYRILDLLFVHVLITTAANSNSRSRVAAADRIARI